VFCASISTPLWSGKAILQLNVTSANAGRATTLPHMAIAARAMLIFFMVKPSLCLFLPAIYAARSDAKLHA
jgi:hypothetical protein